MYGLIVLLVIAWVAMMLLKVASGVIHLILVVAIALFVYKLVTGKKTAL